MATTLKSQKSDVKLKLRTIYYSGKGEYFRNTILDTLLFEGETILEC